ncbi:MAG TPA: 3-deoxy-D-manno-octulosonic acid transferase [Phycisphaerae bacterium]|nr:3-deoxy-D-manno-octulosonic acid transferase [Phycisphaerae bacterium]
MKCTRSSIGWLILVNLVYLLAAAVGWPVYLFLVATRRKYRTCVWERWGLVPNLQPGRKRFWVHAVSVGETEAARTFVPALAEAFPDHEIVISTTTLTGRRRAERLFPDHRIFHFPIDLAPCVLAALSRIKPTTVIQVESEWWPNFFLLTERLGIPVFVVNLRLTERGRRGYLPIRPLMKRVVNSARAIGVQASAYEDRLLSLGADPERIHVTGQMKHDGVAFADTVPGAEALRAEMGLDRDAPLVVAGSTAPGEEAVILEAYRKARKRRPGLRLVLVPRRPESFEPAAEAIRKAGFFPLRRSAGPARGAPGGEPPVILGDTMGELMKWYALADLVIIGRTFVPFGGSNPMEPGSLGRPLLWGPHMFNFPVEASAMREAGAAREVADADALASGVDELLTNPERRRQMGEAARTVIRRMQGATERNVRLIQEALAPEEPR